MRNLKPSQPLRSLRLDSHPQAGKSKSFWSRYRLTLVIGALILFAIIRLSGGAASFKFVMGGSNLITENNRVNVLILGIGGGSHDGATLTDTIIVASYNTQTHQTDLISIPRDIWIDSSGSKVNTIYQTGLLGGQGLKYSENKFGELLGIKLPYTVRIDFAGFVKAVDQLGGIDVKVENGFDDYEYPIDGKEEDLCGFTETQLDVSDDQSAKLGIPKGKQKVYLGPSGQIATSSANLDYSCRFEHISFKPGLTHMDGDTALKFVRSRHGNNNEGSDFARSKRQQLVIEAVRSKVLSLDTLTNLQKMVSLVQTFGQSIDTDIPQNNYLELATLVKQSKFTKSHVLDTEVVPPILIHPDPVNYGGAWVIIPPNNDYGLIKDYIAKILTTP